LLPAGALAGWACTHWKTPPYHGAHQKRTFIKAAESIEIAVDENFTCYASP
jgi:hypothetical protein